ncbi:MAG: CDP-alcohol phosphatidyltransferase family protein [Alphaproteobacteria bacterium]|nr:CDP-alcohol phosphatidyltransferase family protein [Alphaproteobacteria bacterium]MCY4495680.1 CDP-alcohol phosphatidyltransferase family protein [Rhodospirillaceae bacterium]
MNLPNALSLGRLLAVPIVVWLLLQEAYVGAFLIFVLAGVSDAIDGYLAKQFGMDTEIGRFLDPIADKTLLVSVYITLGHQEILPVWLVILVVSRDLLIVGGALLAYTMSQPMRPTPLFISKINTVLQISLAATALGDIAFQVGLTGLVTLLVFAVAASTTLSGARYLGNWIRDSSMEQPR